MSGNRVEVSAEGVDEIDRQLQRLEVEVRQKAMRRAIRKMANRGVRVTRAMVPDNVSGGGDPSFQELKQAIKAKVIVRGDAFTAIVGPTVQAQHAHLLEYGHQMVLGGTIDSGGRVRRAKDPDRTGKGRVIGFVEPSPFVRPSFEIVSQEMEGVLLDELRTVVHTWKPG